MAKKSAIQQMQAIEKAYVGCTVLMRDPHPHAGRTGVVQSLDDTAAGFMFLVKFDDGDGCYFSRASDVTVIKPGQGWKRYKPASKMDDEEELDRIAKRCLAEAFTAEGWKGQLVDCPQNMIALKEAIRSGYRMAVKDQERKEFSSLD